MNSFSLSRSGLLVAGNSLLTLSEFGLQCDMEMVSECNTSTSELEQKMDSDVEMVKKFDEFGLPDVSAYDFS